MKEIVCAGFGGQGVLTAGLILSDVAIHSGKNTTWMPSYGSAMRGGTANCTVKYGDDIIYNPSQEAPDLLLAMNSASFKAFSGIVKPGGIILIGDMVDCDTNTREDVKVVRVPCKEMADSMNHPKGANIVMTGAMVKLMDDFGMDEALDGMNRMFEKKGKGKFTPMNTEAFKAGYNAV